MRLGVAAAILGTCWAGVALAAPTDFSALGAPDREAISAVCADMGAPGTTAWSLCVDRQIDALKGLKVRVDLGALRPEHRAQAEAACQATAQLGPAPLHRCLERQLVRFLPPRERQKALIERGSEPFVARPADSAQTVRQLSNSAPVLATSRVASATPQALPNGGVDNAAATWTAVAIPERPAVLATKKLDPADVFERAGQSVYVVLAARTVDELKSLNGISQASAVAISPQLLVTNCHAIEGKPAILVSQGGRYLNAAQHRADPGTDRCIIQVLEGSVTPIPGVRPFESLKVGERVYAIASPRGLQRTLSEGLIAGLRHRNGLRLVQTGAPAGPGSSGGGLFDTAGNLVGVIAFALPGGEQMNFAIAAAEYWR